MAKKNHTLGKLLALTTTVAAIGGVCYIFRDKIQQSAIYQKSSDKLSGLFGKKSDDFAEDDFFFDDEDDIFDEDDNFPENSKHNREYTSIAGNSKQEEDVPHSPLPDAEPEDSTPVTEDSITPAKETNFSAIEENDTTAEKEYDSPIAEENTTLTSEEKDVSEKENDLSTTEETTDTEESLEEVTEIFADETIPTISFGGFGTPVSTPEPPTTFESDSSKEESEETVTGYEYEGLSDVSEDPDVLEEQDKLDF